MAIPVACQSCGRKFVAPPEFEGKRVKCKGCGEIILIVTTGAPVTIGSDSVEEMDPLTLLAQSHAGNKSRISAPDIGQSRLNIGQIATGVEWVNDSDEPVDSNGLYPNVLKFEYPGASDVDRWLPGGLIVLGYLLLATAAGGPDIKNTQWIAFTRFLTLGLFYSAVIFPITLSMVQKAGRELRFAMPPQLKLRCYSCYMPALLILGWLWTSGGSGLSVMMIFGGVLGLAMSSGIVWLLFRLRDSDVGTTSAYGAGGFAIGLALSVALIVGINMITQLIVVQAKAVASVPVSPYGPGLSWASLPLAPPAAPPARSVPLTVPSSVATTESFKAIAGTDQIGQFETSKIPGLIDDEIEPLSTSPVVGIVRSKATQLSIEPWNTQDWQKLPGTLNLPPHSASKFILSADGRHLAWIAEFPRLAVEVWSFEDATVSAHIDLDRSEGSANLICFVDSNRLLVERGNSKPVAVAPPTAAVPAADAASVAPSSPPPAPATVAEPAKPKHTSIFDDFTNTPSTLSQAAAKQKRPDPLVSKKSDDTITFPPVAIETTGGHLIEVLDASASVTLCSFTLPPLAEDSPSASSSLDSLVHLGTNVAVSPTLQRLVAAANNGDAPMLVQFDLITGKSLPGIKVEEIDPSLSASPAGMAYSNDGKKLAVFFEHNDSALLLCYDSIAGRKISDFVYPFGPLEGQPHGPFQGGALQWLDPAPFWLIYGQGLINTGTGAHLKTADLGVSNVARQRLLDLDRIELLVDGPAGKQVRVLDLDPLKLGLDPDSANPHP